MTRAIIQTAVATIRGKNGRPFAGGRFRGIMHPYIVTDLANDLTHNGVFDTEKYTREGQKWIEAGLAEDNEIEPNLIGWDMIPFIEIWKCKLGYIGGNPLSCGQSRRKFAV